MITASERQGILDEPDVNCRWCAYISHKDEVIVHEQVLHGAELMDARRPWARKAP